MVDHLTSVIPAWIGICLLILTLALSSGPVSWLVAILGILCVAYGIAIHSNNVRLLRRMERYTRSCAVVDY